MVNVEVVYSPADTPPIHVQLTLSAGATVADALLQSGLYNSHPDIVGLAVGIFAKQVPLDTAVKEGDRIEIYRLLLIDPKEKRRQRARQKDVK